MKRLLITVIAVIFSITRATAQEPHTVEFNVSEIVQYYHNELTFCDFDSITGVIVQKDPSYTGTPFWIDENDQVIQANFIVITTVNDGKLLYIEKDNDLLIRMDIHINENEMPAQSLDTVWLHEGLQYNVETLTLRPTEENLGYLYVWESSNWPSDSTYQGYELEVGNAGFYRCNMFDQCLHYSKKEFLVEKAPVIGYITTNLNLNLNELHWTPKGSMYDTIAIYRNGDIVTIEDKHVGSWVDPVFNNENGTPWYTMYAVKNGEIIEESVSRWKTGISLNVQNVTTETVDLSFYGPDNEIGYPLEGYIQFFQLYSIESTGFGLVRSMIPVSTTELMDIENDYDTLVIAAVLWNGIEVFSNMVYPNGGLTKCEEQFGTADKVQIFPNPVTNGILCISTDDAEYRIYNINGQQVKSGRCSQRLDISELSSGVYAIEIREKQSTTTIKFIVE